MTWGGRKVTRARALWAARLPLPCRRCRRPVYANQRWHVGHVVDLARGGAEDDVANQWPEHARCNESAGGTLGAQRSNARKTDLTARRDQRRERSRGIRGV